MSLMISYSFVNNVSLKMDILLYRTALVRILFTIFPPSRVLHMKSSVWDNTQTRGISSSPSQLNSSLRSLCGVTAGSCSLTMDSSRVPTSILEETMVEISIGWISTKFAIVGFWPVFLQWAEVCEEASRENLQLLFPVLSAWLVSS